VNLFRAPEIYLIADSVRAMVFHVDTTMWEGRPSNRILTFEGAEKFRFDLDLRSLTMTALSGEPVEVYRFSRWWPSDLLMWWRLEQSFAFYDETAAKVRRQDYRALFGRDMAQILTALADIMDASEAEARALQKIDSTEGGQRLHPEVRRLVQSDAEEDQVPQEEET